MKVLKNDLRYELLLLQFQLTEEELSYFKGKLDCSLNRIFSYIYHYTDIMYLEFVNKKILCDYLEFQCCKGFKEVSFSEAIKDVKNFLFFMKSIKKIDNTPQVDLSLKNFHLWTRMGDGHSLR